MGHASHGVRLLLATFVVALLALPTAPPASAKVDAKAQLDSLAATWLAEAHANLNDSRDAMRASDFARVLSVLSAADGHLADGRLFVAVDIAVASHASVDQAILDARHGGTPDHKREALIFADALHASASADLPTVSDAIDATTRTIRNPASFEALLLAAYFANLAQEGLDGYADQRARIADSGGLPPAPEFEALLLASRGPGVRSAQAGDLLGLARALNAEGGRIGERNIARFHGLVATSVDTATFSGPSGAKYLGKAHEEHVGGRTFYALATYVRFYRINEDEGIQFQLRNGFATIDTLRAELARSVSSGAALELAGPLGFPALFQRDSAALASYWLAQEKAPQLALSDAVAAERTSLKLSQLLVELPKSGYATDDFSPETVAGAALLLLVATAALTLARKP